MSNFVGKKFPSIEVDAMNEMGDTFKVNVLEEAVKNKKKVVLFWYPKDFTYVCPTELHAFQEAMPDFDKRNTILIGASCDTPEVHFAWLSTPKDNGGIEGVTYPILADANRNLANILKVLDTTNERYDEELDAVQTDGNSTPYRATFILDEDGMVFHQGMNFFPVGRNINEFLRLIDAYAHNQKFGEVCPANWEEGKDAMKENRDGVADYLAKH